jgi:class 3 adenylate cyclase
VDRVVESYGGTTDKQIGITSRQVIASDTGSDTQREFTVTGDSVNLASHLTDLACPGETLVFGILSHNTFYA